MKKKQWQLEGFDTFDGESYPLPGTYLSLEAAEQAAEKRLVYLEQTQPAASSGGQGSMGIQDKVFIIHPDGKRQLYTGKPKEYLNERSLEIVNALVDEWENGDAGLPSNISYGEVFDWLDRIGAKKPATLVSLLKSLEPI
jgi:hypothetical protein